MAFRIENALEIEAPPELVWEVLTDLERYQEWNPFVPHAQCSFVVGEPIDMRVHIFASFAQPQRETVFEFVPAERFCYGVPASRLGHLRSSRCHILRPGNDSQTRYRSEFELAGWLAPLVRLLLGRRMRHGFGAMADGLKKRAEQLQRERSETPG